MTRLARGRVCGRRPYYINEYTADSTIHWGWVLNCARTEEKSWTLVMCTHSLCSGLWMWLAAANACCLGFAVWQAHGLELRARLTTVVCSVGVLSRRGKHAGSSESLPPLPIFVLPYTHYQIHYQNRGRWGRFLTNQKPTTEITVHSSSSA